MKPLLRAAEAAKFIGQGLTALYEKLRAGGPYADPTFPRPIRIGKRMVAWRQEELEAWIASRDRG